METTINEYEGNKPIKEGRIFSRPLFRQSIKANFMLWLVMALGSAAIFVIINLVVGTKQIFTNIDMDKAMTYIQDENMNPLQVLGLFQTFGFSLSRLQAMSTIDLNSVLNDLVYKIAGVLLPMIYVMITCNKLVASQVNDGSMAYVLSTPTNRKKVIRTQYAFMVSSLFLMYVIIYFGAVVSALIANAVTSTLPQGTIFLRTTLYCGGSFICMFGLTGICFGASCWFNKSSRSIAIGGGACVLAFLCCILGLFGNKAFVAVGVGVSAMNVFNYASLYTLLDTEGMGNFAKSVSGIPDAIYTTDWIYKLIILFAIGIVFAFVGAYRFVKKDLPL